MVDRLELAHLDEPDPHVLGSRGEDALPVLLRLAQDLGEGDRGGTKCGSILAC